MNANEPTAMTEEELRAEVDRWAAWLRDAQIQDFEGELGADAVHVAVRLHQLDVELERRGVAPPVE